MTKEEPLKITLDDLSPEEAPAVPEAAAGTLQDKVSATGRSLAGAARDIAGKATNKVTTTAADATNRTAEAARDKVGEAIQEQSKAIVDAIEERMRQQAQKGAEGGLRWLSDKLTVLANRVNEQATAASPPADTPPPAEK